MQIRPDRADIIRVRRTALKRSISVGRLACCGTTKKWIPRHMDIPSPKF
jgi:hypothetical protein